MNGIEPIRLSLLARAAGTTGAAAAAGAPAAEKFTQALKTAVAGTSQLQNQAADIARRYQSGDPAVGLEQMMISMNQANVSFQGLLTTRNRLVQAYQDIMNMQV